MFTRKWLLCASPDPDFSQVAMETRHQRRCFCLCEWNESAGQSDAAVRTEGHDREPMVQQVQEGFRSSTLGASVDRFWCHFRFSSCAALVRPGRHCGGDGGPSGPAARDFAAQSTKMEKQKQKDGFVLVFANAARSVCDGDKQACLIAHI